MTSSADETQLSRFFETWKARKQSFDENYQLFSPHLSPRFNFLTLIAPGEVKLSELIAFLLDPKGDHAQGDLFLKEFLSLLLKEGIAIPSHQLDTGSAKVMCESRTDKIENDLRRIDVKISFGQNFGIAIENKLKEAGDQEKQLEDYVEQLQKCHRQWCLIYLPKNKHVGGIPSEVSAKPENIKKWKETGHYAVLDYSDIYKWLKAAESGCLSDRVRYFLKDFMVYCEQELRGGSEIMESSLIEKYVLDNEVNFSLAIGISEQLADIKNKLIETLLSG
ncbi:MAG: PD-(D/E)XK nuclease family protein [Gallionella sp.]|nr:PD-(D/E)XK nuclease family protein [Gallionella sp.]